MVVAVVHVNKARAELCHIWSDERIWQEVYVVGDNHQIAHAERCVDTTRSIRHEEVLDTEQCHHTYRECHLAHSIALVVVETTLHSHNLATCNGSEDKATFVALNGRDRHIRNILILQAILYIYAVDETA